ncbi:hypothetical protein D9Q98_003500 [Chlorella vulgaris]|uniref:Cytochrome b-c1 complex subunit 7 n=1 Tax=Chlorella vulgaris TaxID=3077 RepID=A0A9D4TT02_CHLVU|nr:hypothetical protein D9Q98_003500 [Chlorella vulgaris]
MAAKGGALAKLFDPLVRFLAPRYQAVVSQELRKYGMRYEDLYDPQLDLDVEEALKRMPQDVVDARNQRLKRAQDISMKHTELPKDMQQLQTPLNFYLRDTLELVKLENDERLALGTGKAFERHLP